MGKDVHEERRAKGTGDSNPSAGGRYSRGARGDTRSQRIVAWRIWRAEQRRLGKQLNGDSE